MLMSLEMRNARRRLLTLIEQQALSVYDETLKTPEQLPCATTQGPCQLCDQCPRAR
jgi:hypothetical protein